MNRLSTLSLILLILRPDRSVTCNSKQYTLIHGFHSLIKARFVLCYVEVGKPRGGLIRYTGGCKYKSRAHELDLYIWFRIRNIRFVSIPLWSWTYLRTYSML